MIALMFIPAFLIAAWLYSLDVRLGKLEKFMHNAADAYFKEHPGKKEKEDNEP